MRVAIIGAGLSGLTLARALSTRGIAVDVFEKSRGLGGRLAVKRLPWANLDIGAQYFTARDSRFKTQVEQWLELGVVARWDFTPYKLTDGELKPSADSQSRYVGMPGMNGMAHSLAGGLNTHRDTRIESIRKQKEGWQLLDARQNIIADGYRWVVSSAPAEQSRLILAETALADRIPVNIHLPCRALGIATKGRVNSMIQGVFGGDTVSWLSRLSSKRETPVTDAYDDVWMLHFSNNWSIRHEHMPDDMFASEGLDWLNATLRDHSDTPLSLRHYVSHYWRYAIPASTAETGKIIADADEGVAVIGDWLAGGRVEGAYLSAIELADYYF